MTRMTVIGCAAAASMLATFASLPAAPIALPAASNGITSWKCLTQPAAQPPGIFATGVRDAACPAQSPALAYASAKTPGTPGAAAAGVVGETRASQRSPIELTALVSGSTVTLTWTLTGWPEAPLFFYFLVGSSPGTNDLVYFETSGADRAFTATNVPAGTYYVRVYPADDDYYYFDGASTEIAVTVGLATIPPNAPSDFGFATADGGPTVTFTWTAPSGGGSPSSYLIDYGASPGVYVGTVDTGSSATSYIVPLSSVPAGLYYLRLRARNAVGSSGASNATIFRSGSAFAFTAPAALTFTVGQPMQHSFCDPAETPCRGGGPRLTAGAGPYYFKLGIASGFPPIGLILSPDGVLSGTPTVEGTATFKVCAVGLGGDCKCATVTITIDDGTAPPPPPPPPPPGTSWTYCVGESTYIYPPPGTSTTRWYGSNTPGQYPFPGKQPECFAYPYYGCIETTTYACNNYALPQTCGSPICGPGVVR